MDFDIEQFKKLKKEQQNKIFKQLHKLGSENENNKSDYHVEKNIIDVEFIGDLGANTAKPPDCWYFDPPE